MGPNPLGKTADDDGSSRTGRDTAVGLSASASCPSNDSCYRNQTADRCFVSRSSRQRFAEGIEVLSRLDPTQAGFAENLGKQPGRALRTEDAGEAF
jgi:hypothetical protein